MPWPFEREYMQLALVAGLVVGLTAPLVGVFMVQRRMSLVGDGIGHVAFAGVAAGALLGVWPVWGALVAAVVAAVGMEELRKRGRGASGDTALALLFYTGIAGGVVLFGMGPGLTADVFSYLFGAILTIDTGDLLAVVVLGLLLVSAMALLGKGMFGVVTDEAWARTAGLPVDALNRVLTVVAALTIVAAMRVVGLLLVAALMVLPAAGAGVVARSFRGTVLGAMAIGAVSVVAGLAASRAFGSPAGATIVLVSALAYGVLALLRGRFFPGQTQRPESSADTRAGVG